MGTASSKENPTSKNPAVVEPVGDEPAVVEPADVEPADVEPANWYKEKENKKVVIDKIDEISQNNTVKLEGGLFLKLVSSPHNIKLAITNSNNDPLIIGVAPPPIDEVDTSYKNEFKDQIKKKMDKQNGGKKKTRRNQKTKKYRKNRRKTNRRKK